MQQDPVKIAILAFPETSGSVVYGLYDLFCAAGRDWGLITQGQEGQQRIQPLIVARDRAPLVVANGVRIHPDARLDECPDVEVICIPEVNVPPGDPLSGPYKAEIEWLEQRYRAGTTLAASCSGAMLFAEGGLLDGQEATTHWAWCNVMENQFPSVRVNRQRALVVSGDGHRLVMTGGGSSWMDLALYLIARTTDVETAMQVARINLIDWHNIGQQPFAQLASVRQVEDAVISRCQVWIAQNYEKTNPVSAMTRLSGLAERTFKRRFRQATGMSPLEYVHALRLEEAKQMLETTECPIEAIACEVGYEDAAFFSRLFRKQVNLTPAQYRKRFAGLRASLMQ